MARPAAAQLVVADVVAQSPTPILVTAIGTVQPVATVMIKSWVDHLADTTLGNEGDCLR